MDFTSKVVLITGASSGVGAATAVHFSKLSARLALTGRNARNLAAVAERCHVGGEHQPLLITADLTKDEDVERIIETVKKHYGRLDILINNAGILITDKITETSMEVFDTIMNVNIRAVFNLTRLAIPLILETEGSIVNISSITGKKPLPGYLSYGMAKASMNFFTKSLAVELGPKKVRVNSISLGYVRTDIFARAGFGVKEITQLEQDYLSLLPRGEIIEADNVAKLIAYLSSDAASAMTGSNVAFDNGLLAT